MCRKHHQSIWTILQPNSYGAFPLPPIDFKYRLLKDQNILTWSHQLLDHKTQFLRYIHHIRTNGGKENQNFTKPLKGDPNFTKPLQVQL